MRPAARLLQHKPLIHFIGKRQWPSTPEAPHAHPFAPAEVQKAFGDFVKKVDAAQSSSTPKQETSNNRAFQNFWEAPSHLWSPRVHQLDDREVDAIM
ncbi:hypothetical protein PUNSTDRAFT_34056, partial [Punctularia strigosozonata HHB-11173 SS5]|uniref:uncharacterized protein n=1 Tax=Punctularia strigosozonata (strain HHB-11173) TaxID=741275 RepID=UPI00044180F1